MLKSKNPAFRDYVKYKIGRNKFMRHIGFEIYKIEAGMIEGSLDVSEIHEQQNGYLHGGIISSLCDMTAGFAAYSLVAEGQQVFTVELKVSYFRPGIGQKAVSRGRVVKPGSMFHFCESEVYIINNGEEKLIAKATTTMAVKDHELG